MYRFYTYHNYTIRYSRGNRWILLLRSALGEADVTESRRQRSCSCLLPRPRTGIITYIMTRICVCASAYPEQVLKNQPTRRGINFFSIKNHFYCAMFSFREPKMRTWVGGCRSPVRAARTLRTAHFTVYNIIYTYLAVYAYNIIIYCVYRYVLQRANVSFVVRSFIQFFSRSGRPCRMTRTFYRDPNSSTTSFSSSGGLFRTGVYILYIYYYTYYTYTLMCIQHMHVTLHIIYCTLYI